MNYKFEYNKYLLQLAIIFVLIGFQNLITANFDWRYLISSTYIIRMATTLGAYVTMTSLAINFKIDREKLTNEEIISKDKYIADFVVDDMQYDFQEFKDNEELKEKRKEWIKKVRNQILELDKEYTLEDRLIYKNGTIEQKEHNEYCKKRNELEELIDEDYIKENLIVLDVDYEKKDLVGVNSNVERHNNGKKVSQREKMFRDLAPRFIMWFMLTSFISAFGLTFNEFENHMVLDIGTKVVGLIFQYIYGVKYAEKFIKEFIIATLNETILFINRYKQWREEKKGVLSYE